MNIVFRVDASLDMGTGHVMRCLTLADMLTENGAHCEFICRDHDGNLIQHIQNKGYTTHSIPVIKYALTEQFSHSHWLGASQEEDLQACNPIIHRLQPDWIVIDHYAIDAQWEKRIRQLTEKIMVIDDLADRQHNCDLLLDQTFERNASEYRHLTQANTDILCGAQFALLRPEFATLRTKSLQKRENPKIKELLVTMGGVDKDNITGRVLQALKNYPLDTEHRITVVMGSTAPWFDSVAKQIESMPCQTRLMSGVSNMAQLMADSDLAIGAAGATSWERCCLGLPTIMLVLADNQRHAAQLLVNANAVKTLELNTLFSEQLGKMIQDFISHPELLTDLSKKSKKITDGQGCSRVVEWIFKKETI